MSTLSKKNYADIAIIAVAVGIFLTMLFCNFNTSLLVDDYAYFFDFSSGVDATNPELCPSLDAGRITNIFQIPASMAEHRNCMNGRVIAHGLVQLFLLMPKFVFNFVNAFMFLLEMLLILKCASGICDRHNQGLMQRINPLILLTLFLINWDFQASFGQVNLWLDGAINYLWAAVLSLVYIQGYVNFFLKGEFSNNKILNALFIVLSLIVGCYNETAAGSVIVFSVGIVAYTRIFKKERVPWFVYTSLLACLCGFAFLIAAPAESVKVGGNSFWEILSGVIQNIPKLASLSQQNILLFLLAAAMLVAGFAVKVDKDILIVSLLLFISALASWGCLLIASYIAQRSMFLTTELLTLLIIIMMFELFHNRAKLCRYMCYAIIAGVVLIASVRVPAGIKDIRKTYKFTDANEKYIVACAEAGISDVYIKVAYEDLPMTKYSALNGLRYLAESPNDWPNVYMAKYYGVDKVYLEYTS